MADNRSGNWLWPDTTNAEGIEEALRVGSWATYWVACSAVLLWIYYNVIALQSPFYRFRDDMPFFLLSTSFHVFTVIISLWSGHAIRARASKFAAVSFFIYAAINFIVNTLLAFVNYELLRFFCVSLSLLFSFSGVRGAYAKNSYREYGSPELARRAKLFSRGLRICPFCSEEISVVAVRCRYCIKNVPPLIHDKILRQSLPRFDFADNASIGCETLDLYHAAVKSFKNLDYTESLRLFSRAAELGDMKSQYAMAVMYSTGNGVIENKAEAFRLYLSAAESGFLDAQYDVGVVYKDGIGIPQNHAHAYLWFSLAATHGHVSAAKLRDLAASRLSPQILGEMQKKAAEWKPTGA